MSATTLAELDVARAPVGQHGGLDLREVVSGPGVSR